MEGGQQGEPPVKTEKQLKKEAEKAAKLEKLKAKQQKLQEQAKTEKIKKEPAKPKAVVEEVTGTKAAFTVAMFLLTFFCHFKNELSLYFLEYLSNLLLSVFFSCQCDFNNITGTIICTNIQWF